MREYIERQAAIIQLSHNKSRGDDEWMLAVESDMEVIRTLPAADVDPVRLGEWLDGYKRQTCSLCKGRGVKSWTFCPYCGARMIYGRRRE